MNLSRFTFSDICVSAATVTQEAYRPIHTSLHTTNNILSSCWRCTVKRKYEGLLLRISLGSSPHENSMHMGTRLISPADVFLALFPVSPFNFFCMLEKKKFSFQYYAKRKAVSGDWEPGYRRIGLISACAYHSRWKGNMRLLKNARLLRNGHTHHRENLARRCILDDHSHEPSQPSYLQECLGLVKVLKLLEGPGNRNDHYAVRASKKSDGHL